MATSRVLVVDDDEAVSEAITHVLKSQNFDVAVAANVPDAHQTYYV